MQRPVKAAKGTGAKLQISRRALFQRINRALARESKQLRTHRAGPAPSGRYFVVDLDRSCIVNRDVDLVKLARELDLIKGYEELAEDAP